MSRYVTVSAVKIALDISGANDDGLLGVLSDMANAEIEAFTRRKFSASADTTRYFDANEDTDGLDLLFDEDLIAVTTVTNGSSSGGDTVSAAKFTTLPVNHTPYFGIRLKGSQDVAWEFFDDPERAISIAGKWAYSILPPKDIVHAATRLVSFYYKQQNTQEDIDRPIVGGDGTIIMPAAMPADVKSILRRYVRIG